MGGQINYATTYSPVIAILNPCEPSPVSSTAKPKFVKPTRKLRRSDPESSIINNFMFYLFT